MQFRWVVGIALWTCFSGPIFSGRSASSPRPTERAAVSAPEKAPHSGPPSAKRY
jgi:hypothetical protein